MILRERFRTHTAYCAVFNSFAISTFCHENYFMERTDDCLYTFQNKLSRVTNSQQAYVRGGKLYVRRAKGVFIRLGLFFFFVLTAEAPAHGWHIL